MDSFESLVQAWSAPAAWGGSTPIVHWTHGAVVFLVDQRAIKLKRPVNLGFLDFSTLERREAALRAEDALNRRLAPGIYQGVLPINEAGELGGSGPVREWALVMRRLAPEDTLAARLDRGVLTTKDLEEVAERLGRFHTTQARAPSGDVAALLRQNLREGRQISGGALSGRLGARLEELLSAALAQAGPVLMTRQDRVVDGHGDLRADHVYLRGAPADPRVVVLDCVEFQACFRALDPVADLAFLTMDLRHRRAPEAAETLWQAWSAAAGEPGEDPGLRTLERLWRGHWALVRAKVADLSPLVRDDTLPALGLALLAGSALQAPDAPPALIALGGLPASGKSTLAKWLAQRLGATWIATDAVRKRIAGPVHYTPAARAAVYEQALDEARLALARGETVVLDATFQEERWREAARQVAAHLQRRCQVVLLRCDPEIGAQRLRERPRGLSDADREVQAEARRRFQEPVGPALCLDNNGTLAQGAFDLVEALVEAGALFAGGHSALDNAAEAP